MTLRDKQSQFVLNVAKLIQYAEKQGYELTFGEAWRTPEQAAWNEAHGKGISKSLHIDRLAIDLNLFDNGDYQTSSEAHRPLGVYWKSLDPHHRWGGDFLDSKGDPKPDGNHYEYNPRM